MNPTLLCIHGFGSRGGVFDLLRGAAPLASYPSQAPDLPGYGAHSGDLVEHAFAEALDFLENYVSGIAGEIVLIGHSMGGALSLKLIERLPQRFAGLVSLEGSMIAEDCGPTIPKLAVSDTVEQVEELHRFLMAFMAPVSPFWQAWTHDIASLHPLTFRNYARDLYALAQTGVLPDMFNALPHKLFLHGDRFENRAIVTLLQPAHIAHVPESGHFLLQDQPDICAQLIADFIRPL